MGGIISLFFAQLVQAALFWGALFGGELWPSPKQQRAGPPDFPTLKKKYITVHNVPVNWGWGGKAIFDGRAKLLGHANL